MSHGPWGGGLVVVAWVMVGVGLMFMGCGMCGFGMIQNFVRGLLWFGGGGCVGFGCDVGCAG